LFLNPDTEIAGSTLDILVGGIKKLPDAGVVGGKILNTDRSVQLSAIQKFPTILGQVFDADWLLRHWPTCPLWNLGPLFSQSTNPTQVDAISGACMLLRREVFSAIGMLSEEYFMYAEDLDLSYKASRAGFRNYYLAQALLIHHGGKSSSKQATKQWGTIMKCHATLHFFCKTRGRLYGVLYRAALASVALVRVVLLALLYSTGTTRNRRFTAHLALKKWAAVLSWAVGLSSTSLPEGI
jgi:N-acetylglucosaminyl-diphospho-decaprenol L-rhamnosyltransferase